MMNATLIGAASAFLFTGVLLAACGADSDDRAENPPLAVWGDALEVGIDYEYNKYTHCGLHYLGWFNGQTWATEDPPPVSRNWTFVDGNSVAGLLTLVDSDLIEYRIVGTDIVIEYRPIQGGPPICF